MNSLFKVVLLVCVLKATAKPMTPEEGRAMFVDVLNNCKGTEGASDDDALGIMTHLIPTTKAGSCLNACVMEKIGIIKDGKFSLEGTVQVAGMGGEPQKAKDVATIGIECVSIVPDDRCDLGKKIMECLHKGAAAIGINPLTDLM